MTGGTWRTDRYGQGIVVAIAPDPQHLAHIEDDWAATAIVAVAQTSRDLAAWAIAKNAAVLGGPPIDAMALDAVVAAAVKSMGAGVNQSDILDQGNRARIAASMKKLPVQRLRARPRGPVCRRPSNGWRGGIAERVRSMPRTLNDG